MKEIESKEVEIIGEELLEEEVQNSTKEKTTKKKKKEKTKKVKPKKEKKEKKTISKKKLGIVLLILGLMLIAIGGTIYIVTELSSNKPTKEPIKVEEPKKEEKPKEETTSFSFIAVGDALIHDGIYYDANTWQVGKDGYYVYDFTSMFTDLAEVIKPYDLKFYNQETIIGGKNLGLSGYPCFNSPNEVAEDLTEIGFNIVNLASNHTMDKGTAGAIYSANYWHKKKDVLAVGSYTSKEHRNTIEVRKENGITYAMLSYTYGTNGIPVPAGYEYLVNVWPTGNGYEAYKAQVKKDVESVRDRVDVLMVSMHWGIEYQTGYYNTYQRDAAEYLASLGVDVIIGTHPHVVQPIEYIDDTLVVYSLGNMISAQVGLDKLVGGVVAFNVEKTTLDGKVTDVSIKDVKADLIYTYYNNFQNFKVIPFYKLNDNLLYGYRNIYNKYKAYLNPKGDKRIQVGFLG